MEILSNPSISTSIKMKEKRIHLGPAAIVAAALCVLALLYIFMIS